MILNRQDIATILRYVVVDPVTGCWNWTRSLQTGGYGQLQVCGRNWLAHRFSWFVHHDRTEPPRLLMHSCDNKRCCNPDHLEPGTHKQNTAAAIARGLMDRMGLAQHTHRPRVRKLSNEQVLDIRHSTDSYADCAKRHGITFAYAWKIRHGQAKRLVV